MSLPPYYFRIRENGAAVYAVDTEDRLSRLEMRQIAIVNARNGEIKPHGSHDLTEADRAAIDLWLSDRRATLNRRERATGWDTVEQLGLTAQWIQSKATDEEIAAVGDTLLMAMHDLRSVIVRKKSDGMERSGP